MSLKPHLRKAYHIVKNYRSATLIYSAGMPRSGSTLLFNILKILIEEKYQGEKIVTGWTEDAFNFPKADVYLVKTHHLHRFDTMRAYKTIYTFRDIRDVLVSRLRKFNAKPTIEIVRYYIEQDIFARKHANLCLKYEDIMANQGNAIEQIKSVFRISIPTIDIIKQLPSINESEGLDNKHDSNSLLYKNHITGTKKGEWHTILNEKLLDQIHHEFKWWLKENNYY
jgi:hypothetical protein